MPDHNTFANFIWQIADLLCGPYRPQQYERMILPMTMVRPFTRIATSGTSQLNVGGPE
jgi:type I restriction enzyme M protein